MKKGRFYGILFAYAFVLVLIPRFFQISVYWLLSAGMVFGLGYLLWFWMRQKKNIRYSKEAIQILEEECDPYRFVQACQEVCKQSGSTAVQRAVAQSNIALGYFLAGETERALSIETELQEKNETEWKQLSLEFACISNLSAMYFDRRNEENLKKQAEKLEILDQKIQTGNPLEQAVKQQRKRMQVYFSVLEGNPQDVEGWCREQFEKAENEYARVSIQYELALIYEAEGQAELQKKCLTYVAEHGNLLQIAKEAEKKLKQME